MSFAVIPILLCMMLVLISPIIIGVYVYRNAKQRGMNAALWTLIAVITPTFIGFIIFLLVRGNYSDLRCPACATRVTEQYVVCPKCGAKLKASCSNCGDPVEHDWKVCPKCASALPEQSSNNYTPPVRNKDTALGKILLLVIIIPIVLIVLVAVLGYTRTNGSISTMSSGQMRASDYRDFPEVVAWLGKCDGDSSKTYALRFQSGYDEQKQTHYLIYLPSVNGLDNVSISNSSGLFRLYAEVKVIERPGGSYDGSYNESYGANLDNSQDKMELIYISHFANKHAGLKLYINGKKTDCEITDVDFSPALVGYNEKEK